MIGMRFLGKNLFTRKSTAAPEDWLLALFGVSTSAAGAAVTPLTALQQPAAQSAVRVISEAAASLKLCVVAIGADGKATEVQNTDAGKVLSAPNEWTGGYELIRNLVIDALTRDNGGLAWVNRLDGKPVEIIHYRPGVIQVDLGQDTGEPIYRIGERTVAGSEIIHLRSPFDRSPVTLAREAIGVLIVMERHAARLFGSGAKPSGVIETPKPLTDEGAKRMLAGWRAAHEGADNAGKTAALWDGATWKQLTLSSVDAQFLELRKFQILEIANAFRVPPSMLYQLDRATWSNSEQMGREFLTYTLEPWLLALEGAISRALFVGDERGKFAVRFDRDDLTRADLTARATAIASLRASKVLSANEGRSWIDLPPYEGGDTYENPNTDRTAKLRSPEDGNATQ